MLNLNDFTHSHGIMEGTVWAVHRPASRLLLVFLDCQIYPLAVSVSNLFLPCWQSIRDLLRRQLCFFMRTKVYVLVCSRATRKHSRISQQRKEDNVTGVVTFSLFKKGEKNTPDFWIVAQLLPLFFNHSSQTFSAGLRSGLFPWKLCLLLFFCLCQWTKSLFWNIPVS